MDINQARKFWKKLLKAIAGAGSNSKITFNNPAVQFTLDAKAGKFDDISDELYEHQLNLIEQESVLYHNQPSASVSTLLVRAFQNTPLAPPDIERLVCVLAHASERVDYSTLIKNQKQQVKAVMNFQTPQEIYEELSKHVYGQNDAKRALSMLAYHHLNGHATSLLMGGPTGSGKSALIEALSKIPGMDIRTLDGSRLVVDGYKGSVHLQDVFPPEGNDNFIICIDEFDKATETHISANGTDFSQMIINQLLLLLEHRPLTFSSNGTSDSTYVADTSKVSVIFIGAFENLMKGMDDRSGSIGFGAEMRKTHDFSNTTLTTEDFIRAGIRREIMGRINDVAFLDPMTAEDFRRILDTPNISPIDRIAAEYHINLTVSNSLKAQLAQQAYESKLGCRAIYSEIKRRLNIMMFQNCNQPFYELDISNPAPIVTRSPAPDYAYAED